MEDKEIQLTRKQIQESLKDKKWQVFRKRLKGKSTSWKLQELRFWLIKHKFSKKAKIQVLNYQNALRSTGQL